MKLGLGTAQFGIDYGISNQWGQTKDEEARRIVEEANRAGLTVIDTASQYGSSEEVLGMTMPEEHSFRIVTKTPVYPRPLITEADVKLLEVTFHRSLTKLKQPSIYGLLIHQADDLLKRNGNCLFEAMQQLKRSGLVRKIGVSVYTPVQIDRIMERYPIDLIQVPVNILDQRLLVGGHLSRLKRAGTELHARSIFLQGLLLMDPGSLPAHFRSVKPQLELFHRSAQQLGLSAKQAALGFVMGLSDIDTVLCGVNHCAQLTELLQVIEKPVPPLDREPFAVWDESILHPSEWKLG